MIRVIDVKAELAQLHSCTGEAKILPRLEKRTAFATLAPYRDGGIFGGSFSGESQWERHQHGDEIVSILEGAATLTIMTDEGPQSFAMTAGMMIVVPQECWHLFQAPAGVTIMTVTPQPTEHIDAQDPRSIALFARLAAQSQQ